MAGLRHAVVSFASENNTTVQAVAFCLLKVGRPDLLEPSAAPPAH
jgi:hypothetical protein